MIDVLTFLLNNAWIGGALGAGGTLLSGLLAGWKKWALIGVAFAGVGAWIAVEKISNANLRAELATAQADRDIAQAARAEVDRSLAAAKEANKNLAAAHDALLADAQAAVAAVTKDRDRQLKEIARLKTVREKIHADAPACTGEPAPYKNALDWLRDTRPAAP